MKVKVGCWVTAIGGIIANVILSMATIYAAKITANSTVKTDSILRVEQEQKYESNSNIEKENLKLKNRNINVQISNIIISTMTEQIEEWKLKNDSYIKFRWVNIRDKWYYMDLENGDIKTGWWKISDKWYLLDEIYGDMKTDWQFVDGKWYYLNLDGSMAIGWKNIDGRWYYMNLKNGDMVTGWNKIEGKWYYMKENGECLLNAITPDGYVVNENGVWIE